MENVVELLKAAESLGLKVGFVRLKGSDMMDDVEFRKAKALEEIADRLARIEDLMRRRGNSEGW